MEIILTLLGFITFFVGLFLFAEDEGKTPFYALLSIFALSLTLWIGLTETNDVELQIHEATSNDKSFSYYVDCENKIIPVPNNTVKVIKTEPRAWSIEFDKYEVIVE